MFKINLSMLHCMRIGIVGITGLSACSTTISDEFKNTQTDVNVLEEVGLDGVLLSSSDPAEAVDYFQNLVDKNPEKVEFRQALARSMIRANRPRQAALVYRELEEAGALTHDDRTEYAVVLSKSGEWERVVETIKTIPESRRNGRQHLSIALGYDHLKRWEEADNSYALAVETSGKPEVAINNWGMSLLGRGKNETAIQYFRRALELRPEFSAAKSNLVLATAIQGEYELPVLSSSDEENAIFMHNLGVLAMRRGEYEVARKLFEDAVKAHPRHYFSAFEKLAELETLVGKRQ